MYDFQYICIYDKKNKNGSIDERKENFVPDGKRANEKFVDYSNKKKYIYTTYRYYVRRARDFAYIYEQIGGVIKPAEQPA